MTTPLFLLRCCEVGISIRDLDLLTIGLVKSKTGDSTDATTYANWYNSVYVPDIEEETESGGGEG